MVVASVVGLVLLTVGFRDLGRGVTIGLLGLTLALLLASFFLPTWWLGMTAIQALVDIGLVLTIFGEDIAVGGR